MSVPAAEDRAGEELPAGVAVHRATAAPAEDAALALLDDHERERLGRLRRPEDRARFVAGRRMAREALGALLGVEPASVPLELTESGRPIVRAGGLDLSIAHAGPHVLVAIVDGGRRIGVDVEGGPGAPVPGDALLEVVCTRTERARLRAIHPDARGDAFLGVWTRKEAVLKADGRGLLVDPTTLEVSVGGFPRLVRGPAGGPEPARVLLLDLPAAPGFRAALAVVG